MCKKFLKTRKNLKKHISRPKNNFLHINILAIVTIFILVATSLSYLWLINDRAILGYKTSSLEKKVEILKEKRQKIELKLAEAQEINQIKEKAQKMEMSVIENVDYLSTTSNGLAVVR